MTLLTYLITYLLTRRESFCKSSEQICRLLGRSFQIACGIVFGSATFCRFGFSLLKPTQIILSTIPFCTQSSMLYGKLNEVPQTNFLFSCKIRS